MIAQKVYLDSEMKEFNGEAYFTIYDLRPLLGKNLSWKLLKIIDGYVPKKETAEFISVKTRYDSMVERFQPVCSYRLVDSIDLISRRIKYAEEGRLGYKRKDIKTWEKELKALQSLQ